jgi:putative tryptophan/tyrosine transport system substrate-binding protein
MAINQGRSVRRREFVTLVGATAAMWPLAARAQQGQRVRRIGVLMNASAEDTLGQASGAAFAQGLQQLGWEVGRNVQIDYRWGAGDTERFRKYAIELIALSPDVILATANSIVGYLQQASRTVPIVFVTTIDPVGSGLVASLARPGGNATGFTNFEFSLNAKLVGLLQTVAAGVTRVAVLRDPFVPAGSAGFAAVQTAAAPLGVELTPVGVHDPEEIERGIAEFARRPNGGLIVVGPPSSVAQINRPLIVTLAAQHRLPAVYATLAFVASGGLISYGSDSVIDCRRAADYVDRILKGEKPADLPVQAPTKYQLVINLKSAKAIGLDIPAGLLAGADEVIE